MKTLVNIKEGFFDNVGAGADPKVKQRWAKITSTKQQITNSKGKHYISVPGSGVYDYRELSKAYEENCGYLSDIVIVKKLNWQKGSMRFIFRKEYDHDNIIVYPKFYLPESPLFGSISLTDLKELLT